MKNSMILAVVGAAAAVSVAQGAVVTANYTGDYGRQVQTSMGNYQTVKFTWTRVDAPGPGVDTTIASTFNTYCVEINQHVSGGNDYTYNVVSAAAHGFSPVQEALLGRLWWSYFAQINTAVESSAFQVAVWEIALDSGLDFAGGGLTINAPADTIALASSWLSAITSATYAGAAESIVVLENGSAQDQITVVPAPGVLALAGLGALAAGRRRR
ncbi:MAG: hypothetical protein ACOYN0_00035 [Phycisphaerales bacterium]